MLPDFPRAKRRIEGMLGHMMKTLEATHMPTISLMRKAFVFEGDRTIIIREDGSTDEGGPQEIKVDFEVGLSEVENMTHDDVVGKLDSLVQEMAEQKSKLFFQEIDRLVNEVGNAVSAGNKPFSMDLFFQALEKMHIDFDEDGNPDKLYIPVHPDLFASIAEVIRRAKSDPECDRRYRELMERKKGEWRAREANRKLVG